MQVAVIGCGIVGISTAYALASRNVNVTVFDVHDTSALGASFATGGVLAPSLALPFASPSLEKSTLGRLRANAKPAHGVAGNINQNLKWLHLRSSRSEVQKYRAARPVMHRLALLSKELLALQHESLQFDAERSEGHIVLCKTQNETDMLLSQIAELKELEIPYKLIDASELGKLEPGLSSSFGFHSAISFPFDGVANCRQYSQLLKSASEKIGAKFEFGQSIKKINPVGGIEIQMANGDIRKEFDQVVMCAGASTKALLRELQLRLPSNDIWGFTLSASIREPLNAPRSAITDLNSNVCIHRLGNRIRATGGFEMTPPSKARETRERNRLYEALERMFPGASNYASGLQTWKGVRDTLPDGLPAIGESAVAGIWVNAAHGAYGWTLAAGAAKFLADKMTKRSDAMDLTALSPQRFAR